MPVKKKTKILVTGGAGFIGSAFVRLKAADKNVRVVVVDKLTYAGDKARIKDVSGKVRFYRADIANAKRMDEIFRKEKPSRVVHFAAETHVDRSIASATDFLKSNVVGTQVLIDVARKYQVRKFVHISTDEVYGESFKGKFKETDPIQPNNPYSASKAAAEFLVKAAVRTHKFPAVIIRPANNYGPWQYPEKLIPVAVSRVLAGKKIPVYGRGKQIREWLFVEDCARAVDIILKKGKPGETYNVGTYYEQENIKTARMILDCLQAPAGQLVFVKDRLGHDFRYSVDYRKAQRLGWKPRVTFHQGLKETVFWYLNHKSWLKKKLS